MATAANPGPIAIVQVRGPKTVQVLSNLTQVKAWPLGLVRLVEFADIDEGCAVCLDDGPMPWAQLMPHGGPRVVQRMVDALIALGAQWSQQPGHSRARYPEADSELEADMLTALARAASPAAIDLLLAQPQRWKQAWQSPLEYEAILARSHQLDRLINPPSVVVAGVSNVGKSTLTNRLLGRMVSLVADLPGTTRDWVASLTELTSENNRGYGVAVRWMDTPGQRTEAEFVERRAIELAHTMIERADVLIAMRDPTTDWPSLPRPADFWLINKIDDGPCAADGSSPDTPLEISALHGHGLAPLQQRVIQILQLDDLEPSPLWAFSPTLQTAMADRTADRLACYVGAST